MVCRGRRDVLRSVRRERKVWPILLILDPVGNGGPGGEDGVWEKEDGAQRNLFGKS